MKKAVRFPIISWLLAVVLVIPASLICLAPSVVEGSPSLAFITGTVKDDKGAPLSGAIVALLESSLVGKVIKTMKTDDQGKFTASVAPGSYRLRAEAAGFKSEQLPRINLDAAVRFSYDFALKRVDTLVDRRGDSKDARWTARSVPRSILHIQDPDVVADNKSAENQQDKIEDRYTEYGLSFHGAVQFFAASSAGRGGQPGANFFGTNFAIASSLNKNVEIALVGQQGFGTGAPQRLAAITTMRPADNHQITTSVGYGTIDLAAPLRRNELGDGEALPLTEIPGGNQVGQAGQVGRIGAPLIARNTKPHALNQFSLSAVDQWQVFRPLLIIYGFDYSRFAGSLSKNRESLLPRFAVQYTPSAQTRINLAVTPGSDEARNSVESFNTENMRVPFETRTAETVSGQDPMPDRSRRFETGIEHLFGKGSSSVEVTAFYDVISGHGVGVMALPLEATPETQAAFQQVAHQVAAMNGAARGLRVMYARHFNDCVTASVGYSFGRGERLNEAALDEITPARLFTGGFFQVASAKLDLDFTQQTGTRISTVVRLSPSAVIFAIDPFAGRMSVYDPNLSIYVTQDLPSFGLPLRWQAIVDLRNLLDQANSVEDGTTQIMTLRTGRSVRGGIAFRW